MEAEFVALLNFPTRQNFTVTSDGQELTPLEDYSQSMSFSRFKNSIYEGCTRETISWPESSHERALNPPNPPILDKDPDQIISIRREGKEQISGSNALAQNHAKCRSLSRRPFLHRRRARAVHMNEVEELHERIAVLEEETRNVKRALLEGMHDRKRLVDEVYRYFQNIDSSLQVRDQFPGESSSVASLAARSSEEAEFDEDRGVGLSLVLCQHSSPFVVRKERQTTAM